MSKENNLLKIKYEGQSHQIDVNTLITSLVHTTTIVQEANKYVDNSKKIDVKIKALEKGSFEILFLLEDSTILNNIFSKGSVEYIPGLVTIVGGIYGAYKFFKGKKISKKEIIDDNSTKIFNEQGDNIIVHNSVVNIYQNSSLCKEAIGKQFEVLEEDINIEGMHIESGKEIIDITREEFEELAFQNITDEEKVDKTDIDNEAILYIVRVSFNKKLKWDFLYKGNKINVFIKDENFKNDVENGLYSFASGDNLIVQLQINYEFSNKYDTYIIKSYLVLKVYKHNRRQIPSDIFLN